jgi:hypothetical protein
LSHLINRRVGSWMIALVCLIGSVCLYARLVVQQSKELGTSRTSDISALYLVAATSESGERSGFPTTLYQVDKENRKLQTVRSLLSPDSDGREDGYDAIRSSDTALSILSNSFEQIAFVHFDDPRRQDFATIPPLQEGSGILALFAVFALPRGLEAPDLLIPTTISASQGHKVFSVAENASGRLRVTPGSEEDYSSILYYGGHGGGEISLGPVAHASGGAILTGIEGNIRIDGAPTVFAMQPGVQELICAAEKKYLILTPLYILGTPEAKNMPDNAILYVHDRSRDLWKKLSIVGNNPYSIHFFEPWLAYSSGKLMRPDGRPAGPGHKNERSEEVPGLLPNLQEEYSRLPIYYPGVLVLQNVEDGRTIRIDTGQEDSEILFVTDNDVLYRVNDTVYQARIDGNSLENSTQIVKGDDVPEIHWAFYSK